MCQEICATQPHQCFVQCRFVDADRVCEIVCAIFLLAQIDLQRAQNHRIDDVIPLKPLQTATCHNHLIRGYPWLLWLFKATLGFSHRCFPEGYPIYRTASSTLSRLSGSQRTSLRRISWHQLSLSLWKIIGPGWSPALLGAGDVLGCLI